MSYKLVETESLIIIDSHQFSTLHNIFEYMMLLTDLNNVKLLEKETMKNIIVVIVVNEIDENEILNCLSNQPIFFPSN